MGVDHWPGVGSGPKPPAALPLGPALGSAGLSEFQCRTMSEMALQTGVGSTGEKDQRRKERSPHLFFLSMSPATRGQVDAPAHILCSRADVSYLPPSFLLTYDVSLSFLPLQILYT